LHSNVQLFTSSFETLAETQAISKSFSLEELRVIPQVKNNSNNINGDGHGRPSGGVRGHSPLEFGYPLLNLLIILVNSDEWLWN